MGNTGPQAVTLNLNTAALKQQLGPRLRVQDAATGSFTLRANSDNPLQLSIPAATCRMFHIFAEEPEEPDQSPSP